MEKLVSWSIIGVTTLFFTFSLINSSLFERKVASEELVSSGGNYKFNQISSKPFALKPLAEGLTSPVDLVDPNLSSKELWIVSQAGRISALLPNGSQKDIADFAFKLFKLNPNYDERGLLGLACHPKFPVKPLVYAYYSSPERQQGVNHVARLIELKYDQKSGKIDLEKERVLMEFLQPEGNHNGGGLKFGPDGFLYLGLGDGGGQGDKHGSVGNAQNLLSPFGKILRIDIDKEDDNKPYSIPNDNPFIGKQALPEVYAYGFRNPWRFSFDKQTGQLWVGDVGQNQWEEVSLVEKGKNYGWRLMEGTKCYNPSENCSEGKMLVNPVFEYPHSVGISVAGGYVYRGKELKNLIGTYIWADWNGTFFLSKQPYEKAATFKTFDKNQFGKKSSWRINSFAEDKDGELYVLAQAEDGPLKGNGTVYKIIKGE